MDRYTYFIKLLFLILTISISLRGTVSAEEAPFRIIAGDVLQITVWKEEGMDRETLVLPDGSISFPLVGSLEAAGHTPEELVTSIKEKLSKLIPNAAVTVIVKAALGHTVSVTGQVGKPGEFVIGHSLTVMQAISQAGGLTPYADEGAIIIIHHEKNKKDSSIAVPYDDIIRGKRLEADITLQPGDVLVVPTAGIF